MVKTSILPVLNILCPLITVLVPTISFDRTFFKVVATFASYLFCLPNEMFKSDQKSKSPLTLSLLVACLIIATLVMISNYFFRPGLEMDLKNRILSKLYSHRLLNPVIKIEGRDVILKGIARNKSEAAKIEAEIQSVSGIHNVDSRLLIQNESD